MEDVTWASWRLKSLTESLFALTATSKLCITSSLWEELPMNVSQKASNSECVSMAWHRHVGASYLCHVVLKSWHNEWFSRHQAIAWTKTHIKSRENAQRMTHMALIRFVHVFVVVVSPSKILNKRSSCDWCERPWSSWHVTLMTDR